MTSSPKRKWKLLSHVQLLATSWTIQFIEFSSQNTGVDTLSLLQGIFPTQELNSGLPHCRQILYQLSYQGSPHHQRIHTSDKEACEKMFHIICHRLSLVQLLSRVQLFATPRTTALQVSLSITNTQSLPKLMSFELVMPSSYLLLCRSLLLLPPVPPSIRVFFNESTLCIRWPKYWSFSFSISPSSEHPGWISFRMDLLDLLAVQGTLESLLQHHSSKASIFRCSVFITVQLSHPYMTTGKTIALTRWTFVGKVMFLFFNMQFRLVITFLSRSKLYVIRGVKINSVGYQFIPIRMAKIQNTDTRCWQGHGATGTVIHCWWECKMVQLLWKTVRLFLTKLNILLPLNLTVMLFGIYPKELKTYVHTKPEHGVYSSFIHSCQNWKQLRCPQ